jgi:chromosome segregation ATPase
VQHRERLLSEYAQLVEKDEGAVLPNGKYISVEAVCRQYAFEREQHSVLRQQHELLVSHREHTGRTRQTTQERLAKAASTLGELRQAYEQLQQQTTHIELLMQTFSAAGLPESTLAGDVKRLQREVAAIQDQLDVQFLELPETISVERLEPAP